MKRSLIIKVLSVAALIIICLSFVTVSFAEPIAEAAEYVSAKGAVVMERSTRTVLYGKNAHVKLPMASTTKIMTALIALERCSIDDIVTVSREAYGAEGSSMYLNAGEMISMSDLLYGLMLASGNDAAIAIAVHVAGSTEAFVELMNDRATQLGLLNTNFVTPNGLHSDEHYTTAYDLCIIACTAMENETFRKIVSTTYHTAESGSITRYLKNKNKLLWQYEGATGLKTGYTKAAGKCLAFSAMRDGMEVVGIVLGSGDIFGEACELMDHAFEEYHMATLVKKDVPIAWINLSRCNKRVLALTAKTDIMIPVEVSGNMRITTRVLTPRTLCDNICAGDEIGSLELYDGSRLVQSVPLVAMYDVRLLSVWDYVQMIIRRMA